MPEVQILLVRRRVDRHIWIICFAVSGQDLVAG